MTDRTNYMRDYMRQRRAKAKAEAAASGPAIANPALALTEDRLRAIVREEIKWALEPVRQALTGLTVSGVSAPTEPEAVPTEADEPDHAHPEPEAGPELTELTVGPVEDQEPTMPDTEEEPDKPQLTDIDVNFVSDADFGPKLGPGSQPGPEALGKRKARAVKLYGTNICEFIPELKENGSSSDINSVSYVMSKGILEQKFKPEKNIMDGINRCITVMTLIVNWGDKELRQRGASDVCSIYNRLRMGGVSLRELQSWKSVCLKHQRKCESLKREQLRYLK